AYYRPLRQLAAQEAHDAAGAKMEDYGAWMRPAFYPQAGEQESATIHREVLAVRSGVGILDYSPLGKILVQGPDAAEFLTRVYVNNVRTLKVGACRYGLMLGEDGIVKDDGVLTRWSENSYLVGTTSGQADRIVEWMEEWLQCEWVDLDVTVESVTTQWAVVMLAGPKAREVLSRLDSGIDLAAAAFPHMSAREGRIGDVPVRVARVSFTGELGYEISVPWQYGLSLWNALLEAGKPLGIIPFGIESLMVMRTEKGFLHVGSDTDGLTLPQDVGFGAIIDKKPEDFIGRRTTMTPDGRRTDRRQLVGLAPVDEASLLPVGGHVVDAAFKAASGHTQGWVTSSFMSPTLGRPVALALVERGRERLGEQVQVFDGGKLLPAKIVSMTAYDPEGERLRM
ncbi:MAG TPA: glycine cleavage T C-terminal barrel domain-containing protein, partial [Solimonas sp.]